MTPTVVVPAMLSFKVSGQWVTQPVQLIGIDEETYANVSDFGQYLAASGESQAARASTCATTGYDERLKHAGWRYRRRAREIRASVSRADGADAAYERAARVIRSAQRDAFAGDHVETRPAVERDDNAHAQRERSTPPFRPASSRSQRRIARPRRSQFDPKRSSSTRAWFSASPCAA